jgi:hypothetical protein
MGIRGLALATTVTTIVVMLALPAHLAREGVLAARRLVGEAARLLPGAVLGYLTVRASVAVGSDLLLVHDVARSWVGLGLILAVAGLLGALAYAGGAMVMGTRIWPARGSAASSRERTTEGGVDGA